MEIDVGNSITEPPFWALLTVTTNDTQQVAVIR
jgi:hypothetical protein